LIVFNLMYSKVVGYGVGRQFLNLANHRDSYRSSEKLRTEPLLPSFVPSPFPQKKKGGPRDGLDDIRERDRLSLPLDVVAPNESTEYTVYRRYVSKGFSPGYGYRPYMI